MSWSIFAISVQDQYVADKMINNILNDTDNASDKEWLVEWYYIIYDALMSEGDQSSIGQRLVVVSDFLRVAIDQWKELDRLTAEWIEDSFYTVHASYIQSTWTDLSSDCYSYNQLIDDVSWSKNIPTNLVIWTWMMEASCWFYFPNNWDWQFQMLYKNKTWTMTIPLFVNEIQDFANFSQNKRNWYETANSASWLTINLTYTNWSIDDYVKHWALYNGLSWSTIYWDIQPWNPDYVRGQYTSEYSWSNKDWLIVDILKYLE